MAAATKLPSIEEVLEMELSELFNLCEDLQLDIEGIDDLVAEEQFQSAILEYIKKIATGRSTTSCLPFGEAAEKFSHTVECKRGQLLRALDGVEQFVLKKEVKQWLKKLDISKLPCWMKRDAFTKTRQKLEGKPVLLVAGATSSGKTTLINALLGEPVLPSSHNAATSVLCEIKYSGSPKAKYAIIHFEKKEKRQTERIHLTDSLGMTQLTAYLNGNRVKANEIVPCQDDDWKCARVEVFWPLKFLKDFTLVDSPGVTEEEGESITRCITEQFQRDFACGYIYVLDATQAAEEASQVGGLLKTVMEATQSPPLAGAALFVVNKWDMLIQQQNEEEQQEYLARVAYNINRRWPGFSREKQLLTMNAKLAAQAQELGAPTNDMKNLCRRITDLLPIGMDNMLLKSVRQPVELMDVTEIALDTTVRELCLPEEDRMMKYTEDWKKLEAFRQSMECGNLAKAAYLLDAKMQELAHIFREYLKSKESLKCLSELRSSVEDFSHSNVGNLVKKAVIQTITEHPKYKSACTWANLKITPIVDDSYRDFLLLPGAEFYSRNLGLDDLIELEAIGFSSGSVDSETAEAVGYVLGALLPINWPFWLIAAITGPIGLAIAAASTKSSDSSDDDGLVKVCGGFSPALPALAVSFAGGQIAGKIARSLSNARQRRQSRKAITKSYQQLVNKLCDSDGKFLQQLIRRLLQNAVDSVKKMGEDIPEQLQDLERQLRARVRQQASDLVSYTHVLQSCRTLKKNLLAFILELTASSEVGDADQIKGKAPFRLGRLGPLFKIEEKEKLMTLEVIDSDIVETKSDDIMSVKQCRRLRHKNIVSVYGLVHLCDEPLQLGLLYEWCEGGTIADEFIGDDNYGLANNSSLFERAQLVVLQMFSGLNYLHTSAIVHGHLRPEAIWITRTGTIKIGEVGFCKLSSESVSLSTTDVVYLAPEVILVRPYGFPADIFSMGVILMEIWNGKRAVAAPAMKTTDTPFLQISEPKYVPSGVSDDSTTTIEKFTSRWKCVVCQCISDDAKCRPSAEECLRSASNLLDI